MTRIAPLPCAAAEGVAQLHLACFPDEPWDGPAFARLLALPGCFGFLAWEGKQPVGFVLARDLGVECEILSLGVEPSRRRRGVGAGLVGTVVAETLRRNLASVVLEVATDNAAAQRLYAGAGFVQVGYRPRYYRRPSGLADAFILRRVL